MPRGCTPESILGQEAQMQDWKMSFRGRHQLLLCRPYFSLSLPRFSWEFFFTHFNFLAVCSLFILESPFQLWSFQLSRASETRRLFWATSWLATLLCGVQCTRVGGSASLLSEEMNKTCKSVLHRRVLRAARDSSRTLSCSVQARRCRGRQECYFFDYEEVSCLLSWWKAMDLRNLQNCAKKFFCWVRRDESCLRQVWQPEKQLGIVSCYLELLQKALATDQYSWPRDKFCKLRKQLSFVLSCFSKRDKSLRRWRRLNGASKSAEEGQITPTASILQNQIYISRSWLTAGQKFHKVSLSDGPPAKRIEKMNDSEKKSCSAVWV